MPDFQNSFTATLSRKFAIKPSLQIPPHLNGVATLPCEILMSDNIACPICWGTIFTNTNSQVATVVTEASHNDRFHQPWLPYQRISRWCSPISTRRLLPSLCAKTVFCSDVIILCSGGSTLRHRPPNLAQPPPRKFLDTVVLLLVELIGSIVNFA